MSLSAPLPNDTDSADKVTATNDGAPRWVAKLTSRHLDGPNVAGPTHCAFSRQMVSGLVAIGVLLAGVISVTGVPRQWDLAFVPVILALAASAGMCSQRH